MFIEFNKLSSKYNIITFFLQFLDNIVRRANKNSCNTFCYKRTQGGLCPEGSSSNRSLECWHVIDPRTLPLFYLTRKLFSNTKFLQTRLCSNDGISIIRIILSLFRSLLILVSLRKFFLEILLVLIGLAVNYFVKFKQDVAVKFLLIYINNNETLYKEFLNTQVIFWFSII